MLKPDASELSSTLRRTSSTLVASVVTSNPSPRSWSAMRSTAAAFDVSTTPRRFVDHHERARRCAQRRPGRSRRREIERTGRPGERRVQRDVDTSFEDPRPVRVQQWDLRRRLPGRGHRVGQFALFVEEVGQSARHAIRFDHDHGGVVDFIEQRPLLIHEEGHPALHAVEELTRRESVERRAAPRHGVDHALGALTRVVAQEPFARRGDHCLVEVVQGTLIGDVEGGQSLDLVTKKSRRIGSCPCAGQRSTMPPRTANSARCSTRLSRR